ncbi:MAG: 23S rRNA (uracil(1939)-C(5))-methyltransferase RlmD [Planctomycetota bacterium]
MSEAALAPPRKGEEIDVRLEELDAKGRAVGYAGPHRVRVLNAVPGQRVRARAGGRRRGVTLAVAVQVLDPGPDSVPARCPHVASCGGCSFQELRYARQLEELARLLRRALAPLGTELPIAPVAGCADPFAYRNKMDFTFSSRRWIEPGEPENAPRDFAVGLHVAGRHDRVLDIERCAIAFAGADAILATVRRAARARNLVPWDVRAHTGLLRHLVLRRGHATGEVLAQLVTSEEAAASVVPLVREVLAAHPEITTFVQSVSSGVALVAGGREIVHHGPGWIHEEVAGRRFRVSAGSFFQTNTAQAERLVAVVRERLALTGREVLFDLYCGGGLLTLTAGAAAREAWGFELAPAAIEDARRNSVLNGIASARWVSGDLRHQLAPAALAHRGAPAPDVCIADPPRAGMHAAVVAAIARLAPRRIVYVSCHAPSAARDVALLLPLGWRLLAVEPIDLFPHTPHLECVLTLERPPGAAGG